MTTATPESESNVLAASTPTGPGVASSRDARAYELVVATAPVAAATWWATGAAVAVPVILVGAMGLAAAVSDFRTGRIPNRLILIALAVLAGSWVLVSVVDDRPMAPLLADLAAGLVLSGAPAMFVIWLVAPRVLGGGDWKLLSVLGIAVGYLAPLGATVIVMAAFVGGVGVAAVVRQRNIILGPPLAVGYAAAVAAVTFAPDLFDNWYR
jgi:Flp pilus assembly protein protease CpaA